MPYRLSTISKHRPGCCRLCLLYQRCALFILQGTFFFSPLTSGTSEHRLCEPMSFGDMHVSVGGMQPTNQGTHCKKQNLCKSLRRRRGTLRLQWNSTNSRDCPTFLLEPVVSSWDDDENSKQTGNWCGLSDQMGLCTTCHPYVCGRLRRTSLRDALRTRMAVNQLVSV